MLVEGLAEWAAVPVWPAARRADAAALDQGDASALPDDADFSGTDQDVASAYARSEVLVAGCVERWGVGAVVGWVTDWSSSQPPDAAQLTDAYTAELTRRR